MPVHETPGLCRQFDTSVRICVSQLKLDVLNSVMVFSCVNKC